MKSLTVSILIPTNKQIKPYTKRTGHSTISGIAFMRGIATKEFTMINTKNAAATKRNAKMISFFANPVKRIINDMQQ